ncbi:retrovirus-related pol polyprotein from transposon TNT 1-94 [Tanacetum coccineum]
MVPLKEDVYVLAAGEGSVDPDQSRKSLLFYLLRKALYGLKQAPRAWYDELSNFLMSKGFTKGTIDPTLFKIKYGEDILLVQIYVDDIIFGSTNPKYSKRFEKLMHSRFEMSLMGEMKFFLGLQIHQSPKGIFINQAKYALEILKKHNMDNCHSIGTPLATKPKLDVDLSGEPVDQSDYRSKIGSLMYLTSSRPDLVQAVCYCARYQARPTQKHLKETPIMPEALILGNGGIQFLGDKLVSWMSKKQNCTASLQQRQSTWRYLQVVLNVKRDPTGTFTVKDARYRIDQNILPTLAHATTWDKSIPVASWLRATQQPSPWCQTPHHTSAVSLSRRTYQPARVFRDGLRSAGEKGVEGDWGCLRSDIDDGLVHFDTFFGRSGDCPA